MMISVVDRQRVVISAINKDDELYLLHHKRHQQGVNKLVQNMQSRLTELLGEEHIKQVYEEAKGMARPRRQMGIHNATLKSYAAALVARYGNPQDDGENTSMVNTQDGDSPANALPRLVTKPQNQVTDSTTIRDIQEDISKLTARLQKLEQESKEMRAHQKNLDSILATKVAAHT